MAGAGSAEACARAVARYGFPVMSAAEIIELIKKLPPEERAEVREFIRGDEAASSDVRRIDRDRAKEIGKELFDRHPELFRKLAQ